LTSLKNSRECAAAEFDEQIEVVEPLADLDLCDLGEWPGKVERRVECSGAALCFVPGCRPTLEFERTRRAGGQTDRSFTPSFQVI